MRLLLLALGLGAVAALDGKSIVDPVLKHDAKQCGQYLCPGFPNAAEVRAPILALSLERKARPSPTRARAHRLLCAQKYILDGCEGDFKDTMVSMSAATEETSRTSSSAVSTSLLLTLSGSCGVAALLIGFVAGAREERQIGYRSPVV